MITLVSESFSLLMKHDSMPMVHPSVSDQANFLISYQKFLPLLDDICIYYQFEQFTEKFRGLVNKNPLLYHELYTLHENCHANETH